MPNTAQKNRSTYLYTIIILVGIAVGESPTGCVTWWKSRSVVDGGRHDEVSCAVFVRDFARGLVLFEWTAVAGETNRALHTTQPMAQV